MGGRRWTEKEIEKLEELISSHTVEEIAPKLGRSYDAVNIKLSRIGVGGFEKSTDLLTMHQVEIMTGVDHGKIKRLWCANGLKFSRVGNYVVCKQEDLIRFLKKHPNLWNAADVNDDTLLCGYKWYREKRSIDRRQPYFWDEMQIFTLRRMYSEGRPYKEIADAIGKTVSSCKQKICAMRKAGVRV